jgi:hypothetical protein
MSKKCSSHGGFKAGITGADNKKIERNGIEAIHDMNRRSRRTHLLALLSKLGGGVSLTIRELRMTCEHFMKHSPT